MKRMEPTAQDGVELLTLRDIAEMYERLAAEKDFEDAITAAEVKYMMCGQLVRIFRNTYAQRTDTRPKPAGS